MRCIYVIFIGLLFLLIGASAKAEELRQDGNELLRDCTASVRRDGVDSYRAGWCLGYLAGVRHTRSLYTKFPSVDCTPQEVTSGQIKSIVVKYLQDHPEKLHYTNYGLVNMALNEAFPCKAQLAPK